jgi:hypothetical protein
MAENHIARLIRERDEAQASLRAVREALTDMQRYYTSSKFHGPDNDYTYVSTDLMPKLREATFLTIGS